MSNFEYKTQSAEVFMRCPECVKLYVVQLSSLQSSTPYFDCQVCQTRFKLSGDLVPGELIPTQRVSVETTTEVKDCPQCGHINLVEAEECSSCQVVFKKINLLAQKKANPSTLDIQWALLVDRFNDLGQHNQFLKLCLEMNELDWAQKKYEELNSASGGDPTCQGMIKKISKLKQDIFESRMQKIKKISWSRLAYWAFLGLGLICFWAGIINHSLKNLTGLGIAIWALAYGLTISVRGSSVSFRDFIDPKS